MIFISSIICGLADLLWGGQFDSKIPDFLKSIGRRVLAISLILGGLYLSLGLYPSLICMTGYLLVRIMGWRFILNGEAFLHMGEAKHIGYAFFHGLFFLFIPVVAYLAYGFNLYLGVIYWLIVSLALALLFCIIMQIGNKKGKDFVPQKEFFWGALFGLSSVMYFNPDIQSQLLTALGTI